MTDKRDELVAGLQEEEQRLLGAYAELEEKIEGVQGELKAISDAIAALTGQKPAKSRRRRAGARRRGQGAGRRRRGAGVSTDDVIEHVRHALQKVETATKDQLKDRIGEAVAAQGRSRAGLHLALDRALKSEYFVEESGSYRLA